MRMNRVVTHVHDSAGKEPWSRWGLENKALKIGDVNVKFNMEKTNEF